MKKTKPAPVKLVAAVERALGILNAFNMEAPVQTLSQIAERTKLQKSTALRLLATLERYGYIGRGKDGRYHLGVKLAHLGAVHRASFRRDDYISAALEALSNDTGESSTFYVRQGDNRLCWLRVHSRHLLREVVNVGDLLPMNETSASQILRIFEKLSWPEVRDHPELVRKSSRVGDTMTVSLSAPVFDSDGLAGVIAISGPVGRLDIDDPKVAELLLTTVAELNDKLCEDAVH